MTTQFWKARPLITLKKENDWELVQANRSGCHSLQLVTAKSGDRTVCFNLMDTKRTQSLAHLTRTRRRNTELIVDLLQFDAACEKKALRGALIN